MAWRAFSDRPAENLHTASGNMTESVIRSSGAVGLVDMIRGLRGRVEKRRQREIAARRFSLEAKGETLNGLLDECIVCGEYVKSKCWTCLSMHVRTYLCKNYECQSYANEGCHSFRTCGSVCGLKKYYCYQPSFFRKGMRMEAPAVDVSQLECVD